MVRGKDFTTQRALGLRERLGAIPLARIVIAARSKSSSCGR
jgi:hypothetical protein